MLLTLLKAASGGSMAGPVFTNLTSNGTSSATSGVTASVSPTANRLIFVAVHAYLATGSVQPATPTVTGNGITYTLVKSQDTDTAGADRGTLFLFRGMSSSPTPGAITVSFGAVSQTRIQWAVDQSDANVNTSGSNGAGAIVQSTGATLGAAATSNAVNFAAAMRFTSSGYSCWGHQVQEAQTPRSGWTEVADVSVVSLATVETQYIAGTDTAGGSSWTTSSRAGGILVEVAPAPVLLASWNYGEASGDVLDQSGNSRSFTLSTASRTAAGGGYTYGGAQPNTKAIGQSTTGQVQAGPAITGLNAPARTVETWAKGAGTNDPGWFLMHHKTTGDTGVFGYLYLSGTFSGRCKNSAGTATDITSTPDSANWHHWAMVADGKVFRLYKDGVQVSTDQTMTSIQDGDDYRIFDNGGSTLKLSETRIYDGALSTDQINADMTTPVSGGGISGTAAPTQGADTATASGQLGYSGTSAATQAANTSTATGTVVNPVTGTAAASQAGQTANAAGNLGYSGTSARTQANQTSAATGQLGYTGTATAAQATQTATASGTVSAAGISGNAAVTQAANTSTATGQLGYAGTASPSQASQTSAASGQLGYSGTVARTQAAQTSNASGQLGYTGTSTAGQANQTGNATGTYTSAGSFTGTAAATQAGQTGAAAGQLGYSGTSTANQANQASTATGSVVNPVAGTASPTQASQSSAATGKLGYSATATPAQAANFATASGLVVNPTTGTGSATQANQTASISGYFMPLVLLGTAGAAVGPAPTATAAAASASGATSGVMTVPTATGG